MRQHLERIYKQHRQGLFALALSITRCPARAEDAVHEAFARLWKLRQEPSQDREAYVYGAVRNAALDQLRRRPPPATELDQASIYDDRQLGAEAAAISVERQQHIRAALENLDESDRQALVLRIYGDLTFQQMAQVLDEPLPTVASRYRRALAKLREQLPEDL
jgi:RNA polymerase sigma-70 factor (ECF subfamily)